jgi:hypothetical protein
MARSAVWSALINHYHSDYYYDYYYYYNYYCSPFNYYF